MLENQITEMGSSEGEDLPMDRVEERRHGQISQTNNTKRTVFWELAMLSNLHHTYHPRSKPDARIKKKYSEVGNVQDQASGDFGANSDLSMAGRVDHWPLTLGIKKRFETNEIDGPPPQKNAHTHHVLQMISRGL